MTDEERWARVLARDRAADGLFVTAVRSTGIFCRPSCPARHPHRRNIVFLPDASAAAAAGYRACLRCRPESMSREAEAVTLACRAIERAEDAPTLATLAAATGLAPSHFHRLFRRATGVTPREWWAAGRAARAREALNREARVTDAIHDAGYGSSGRFYAEAGARLGMTPTRWRDGGRGETIHHAFGETSLGLVLVGLTTRGVASITLGDERDAMLADLRRRFPHADLRPAGDEAAEAVATIAAAVDRPGASPDLSLDIRGTAFQERVWQALTRIPAGETRSYGEVAAALGAPAATRAVAAACAANKLAVLIPCHRVVGKNGSLTGYRWGTERKRKLLDAELSAAPASLPPE